LGWWIAKTGVRVYILLQRSDYWFADVLPYATDYRVFLYFAAISIATGFLFGLAPVLRLSQLDVNTALKDGGPAVLGGRDGKRLSSLLIAGEVALTVVLLAGAGVMIRSFLNIYNADVGARTENVLAAYVALPPDRYPDGEAQISFVERLKSRLEALPAVESVALGIAPTETPGRSPYEVADAPPVDERNRPVTFAASVSPGYFQTLGAMLIFGRDFSDLDRASSRPVVIVNERFASRNWPGENPVGKRLRLFRDGKNPNWLTVVGMVPNVSQADPTRQEFDAMVYLPFLQRPTPGLGILARTRVPPESVLAAVRRELHGVDSQLPFQHLVPLKAWMARVGGAYELSRNIAILLLIFGTSALLLASVGLYAVVSHSVSRSTQEIGIRTALGATAPDIRRLVFRQGMLPLGTGIGIGLAASCAVNRLIETELVNVSFTDPVVIVASTAVLVLSAALGCWIPARRAIRIDPVVALKYE
jgi:predicted permease